MKNKILNLLDEYKKSRSLLVKNYFQMEKSGAYTEEYLSKELDKLERQISQLKSKISTEIVDIINAAITSKQDQQKKENRAKMLDGQYQTGLSNFIKGIENGAYSNDDISFIVNNNYKDDYYAVKLINSAIEMKKSFPENLIFSFELPNVMEKTVNYLIRGRENVQKYVNWPFSIGRTESFDDDLLRIVSLEDFFANFFDENLNYIEKRN